MIPIEFKALGCIGVIVAAFACGAEWKDRGWAERVAKAESENKSHVIELERLQKKNEWLLLSSVDDILTEEEAKAEVIYREKIVYRDSPSAGTCKFPPSGVQIINDSAGLPRVPEASGNAEAGREEVSDIEVVDVVSANYIICRKELVKFQGLWDWAESVYNTD